MAWPWLTQRLGIKLELKLSLLRSVNFDARINEAYRHFYQSY